MGRILSWTATASKDGGDSGLHGLKDFFSGTIYALSHSVRKGQNTVPDIYQTTRHRWTGSQFAISELQERSNMQTETLDHPCPSSEAGDFENGAEYPGGDQGGLQPV